MVPGMVAIYTTIFYYSPKGNIEVLTLPSFKDDSYATSWKYRTIELGNRYDDSKPMAVRGIYRGLLGGGGIAGIYHTNSATCSRLCIEDAVFDIRIFRLQNGDMHEIDDAFVPSDYMGVKFTKLFHIIERDGLSYYNDGRKVE